jgi:heme/copper-type cytochrome/quinol oxidase subunit 3
MNPRRTIDVSGLPAGVLDYRANLWWGNLLLAVIETTMFGLLIASYFYVRMNFVQWPPSKINFLPVIHHAVPEWTLPTINLVLILLGCIPMIMVDRAARQQRQRTVQIGLVFCILFGLITSVIRYEEFGSLIFRWDANAYASATWLILGMHMGHLIVETCEAMLLASWAFFRQLDDKHVLDITVTASYWYWVAAIWIPIYVIVYWGPRF